MAGVPKGASLPQVGVIRRLEPIVYNRIAAGEVIQRPINCIKEMIENSIDAKATNVQIIVKDGGLKSLCIVDNGTGIRKEDMALVCERHTTSKLSTFEDLETISTFGFRGEALASISHVAHVTITTMTAGAVHGYKAFYLDGRLASKDGSSCDPKPCPGVQGTQIVVEDLFYNSPLRKAALSPSDEYSRIYDVIVRYALHNHGVAFNLKKMGENKADVSTKRNNTIRDNIRDLFGSSLARDLIEILLDVTEMECPFKLGGFVSGPTWQSKKNIFILFINNRLVDWGPLKRSLETQLSLAMGKMVHSWIYLSLNVDSRRVDVNMHPTKKEVKLQDETFIIAKVTEYMANKLDLANSTREFKTNNKSVSAEAALQKSSSSNGNSPWKTVRVDPNEGSMDSYLNPSSSLFGSTVETQQLQESLKTAQESSNVYESPSHSTLHTSRIPNVLSGPHRGSTGISPPKYNGARPISLLTEEEESNQDGNHVRSGGLSLAGGSSSPYTPNPKKRSREDTEERSTALQSPSYESSPSRSSMGRSPVAGRSLVPRTPTRTRDLKDKELTSVRELLEEIERNQSLALNNMIKSSVFVGCVSANKCLVQYDKQLYIWDLRHFSYHLIYQEVLHNFSRFNFYELSEPAPIRELVLLELNSQRSNLDPHYESSEDVAAAVEAMLLKRHVCEILWSYFRIKISPKGEILTLPEVIEGYMPVLDGLAEFTLKLYTEIGWVDEKGSIEKIAQVLAGLYATPLEEDFEVTSTSPLVSPDLGWAIEHQIFPALKRRFQAPSEFLQGDKVVRHVADLEKLYKIFERC